MAVANHWIVTGNFTDDGAVGWRRADGTWARKIEEAGLVDEPTATAFAAAAATHEQREIVGPYGIAVHAEHGAVDPLTARERIRANGPTIRIGR